MSTAQILTELPHLSHADRREIARRLIELEEEAQILADYDARADTNFQLLDALEAEDDAARTRPGEIWLVDLGMTAKVRPCLLLSDYPADDELALLIVVPHTTSVRGNRWEFAANLPFLKAGTFHLQQIQPVSLARLERKLGEMPPTVLTELRQAMVSLLRL